MVGNVIFIVITMVIVISILHLALNAEGSGYGIAAVPATIALLLGLLKLAGFVSFSWWWVASPVLLMWAILLLIGVVIYVIDKTK